MSVVIWNFGWPHATPSEDVIASVILLLFTKFLLDRGLF